MIFNTRNSFDVFSLFPDAENTACRRRSLLIARWRRGADGHLERRWVRIPPR